MESRNRSAKTKHAMYLLSELERMKDNRIACDFEIEVDGQSFPVHRNILIATSKYFRQYFSGDGECSQNIVMETLTVEGVSACIEYMYTGEVQITSATVGGIIEASHLLEIKNIQEICLQFLREHISIQTCLLISKLFHLYGSEEDDVQINHYIASHLQEVMKVSEFFGVTNEELALFLELSSVSHELAWKGITEWIEEDEEEKLENLPDLLQNLLESKDPPLRFLIENIWNHNFVHKSRSSRDICIKSFLAYDEEAFESQLSAELCFTLKEGIKDHGTAYSIRFNHVLNNYIASDSTKTFVHEKFMKLTFEDLWDVYHSEYLHRPQEVKSWGIFLKWVKHNASRHTHLPSLMSLLNFQEIPAKYILKDIRSEPLVVQSPECRKILQRAASFCTAPNIVVMLDSGTGLLETVDFETGYRSNIASFEQSEFLGIISVQGDLYSLQNKELHKFCKNGLWQWMAGLGRKPKGGAQIVSFQGKIFLVEKNKMSCYDPSKGTWNEQLDGCRLNQGFCLVATNNFIYALGGWLNWHEAVRFDPDASMWEAICPPKVGRRGAAAAFYYGKIYVLGGSGLRACKGDVECYDEENQTWSTIASLVEPRAWHCAVVRQNSLYVVGGSPDEGNLQLYDRSLDCWKLRKGILEPKGRILISVCTL